jgi:xylan 1,4-beta-xylosidase
VVLTIAGLPASMKSAKIEEFRVDHDNGNAYTAWQRMGRPEKPTGAQYSELELAGRLTIVKPPESVTIEQATTSRQFKLPRQGLVLLRLKW